MFCTDCGYNLTETKGSFCPNCGLQFNKNTSQEIVQASISSLPSPTKVSAQGKSKSRKVKVAMLTVTALLIFGVAYGWHNGIIGDDRDTALVGRWQTDYFSSIDPLVIEFSRNGTAIIDGRQRLLNITRSTQEGRLILHEDIIFSTSYYFSKRMHSEFSDPLIYEIELLHAPGFSEHDNRRMFGRTATPDFARLASEAQVIYGAWWTPGTASRSQHFVPFLEFRENQSVVFPLSSFPILGLSSHFSDSYTILNWSTQDDILTIYGYTEEVYDYLISNSELSIFTWWGDPVIFTKLDFGE